MNDEGYLSGKEEMERLHVDSNIDLGLGFEEKLVTLKARAGDAKMDGEGKKKGGANKKTKLVQVKVESEDDEPIGSLFKSKKLRNPKRVKSEGGKTEKVKKVRAEKMEVKEDDLGEMDDTLASFRKKLKGPKLGKDGGSGTGKGKGLGLVTNQVEESPSCSGDGSALLLDLGSADVLKCRGKKLKGAKIGKDGGSGTNDKAKGSALNVSGLVSKQVEEVPTCSGDGSPLVPELGMVDTAKRWGKSLKGSKLRKDGGSGTGKGKNSVLSMAESQLKQEEESVTCSDGGLNLQFDVRPVDVPKRQRKRSGIATTLKKAGDQSEFGDVLDQRSGDRGSQEISVKKEKEKVPTVGESCNHSSDENLEFSLSEFIRKSHSGSVKKARSSSSRKKRKVTPDSGDGLGGISDEVSKDVLPTRESHSTSVLSSEFPSTDGGSNLASGRSSTDPELVKETVETQGLYERPSQASCWTQEGKVAGPVQELARLPEFAENIGRSIGDGCNKSLEEVSRVSSSSLIQSGPRSVTDFIANSAVPNDDECNRCEKSPEGISGDPVPISDLPSSHSGFVTNMSEKPVAPTIDEFDRIKICEETPENLGSSDYHCDAASREFLSRQVHTSCHGAAPKFVGETESFKSRLKPCSNGEENAVSADDELNRLPRQTSENLLSSVGLISSDVNMNSADVLGDRSGLCGGCPSNAIEEPSASFTMPNNETVPCVDDDQVGIRSKRKCSDYCLKNGDRISQPCENTFPELSGAKLTSVAWKSEAEDIAGDDEVAQPFRIKLGDCLMHTMQDSASVSDPLKMAESPRLEGFVQFSDGSLQNSKLQQLSSAAGPLLKKDETVAEDEDSYQTLGTFLEESRLATAPKRAGEIPRSDGRLHLVLEPDDAVKSSDFCSPINQEGELVAPDDVSNHFSDGSLQVFSASPQYKPSDDGEGSPSPCQDKQEIMVACSQSIELEPRETLPDESGKEFEPENKDGKLLPMQRAVREVKKRRHEDMAYEGDTDWDFLVHGQGIFENSRVVDEERPPRVKNKLNFLLTMGLEADDISTAAVAAGLKARAAGPFEKIRFKDILKRRGGLQEYLECRNLILGLWSKDTSRILPLSDCGVTDTVCKDESSRVSLIREIYTFLNRNGYINAGIAYEKEKAYLDAKATCGLSEGTIKESFGAQVADSEDGAAFIFSQAKSSEKLTEVKTNMLSTTDKSLSEATNIQKHLVTSTGSESSALLESEECVVISDRENGWIDAKLPNRTANLDALTNPSSEVADDGQDTLSGLEPIKDSYGIQSSEVDPVEEKDSGECDLKVQRKIIVIGAGPAGLTAARHLQRQGFSVTVLEARNRLGGRVYTDRSSLSVPVDLGASIITGVEADIATERRPDPSSLICSQLGLELTVLNSDCPLYDTVTGQKVPAELDEALEAEYNSLLDDTVVLVQQKGERAVRLSLEDGLEYALKKRRMSQLMSDAEKFDLDASVLASFDTGANGLNRKLPNSSKEEILSPLERRVMNWHFANLEYGCAALLKEVSLPHWNQDDVYGGFGGAHCMIKGGYSTVIDSLGKGLHIYLNHVVTEVSYSMKGSGGTDEQLRKVKVSTSNGSEFLGDAVLVTVPLGCLKANTIKFSPSLPEWKESSIRQLGFGVLNKVVLQFPEVFWDDSVDYFGATAEETDRRGQCFMFWNVKKTVGAPVLIALVVGKAALDGQSMTSSDHVNHAVKVLRKLFGEASVPDPVASVVTNWGQDPFSRGAYSYVAVGASGEVYDILGRPVENCLFFAGEATCKEHPDTVGGAMMSGLREAVRIIDILNTGHDHTAEVEAMEAAQRQSESERNEVRDILKRLEAIELSNVLSKSSLDGDRMLTKEALLQDMFHNAKTTAGRLHLAKKLLNLPVEALKSFAGTKEGLSTLNSWILDSMGKDGTQLLRHCVRLLVLVSTNLIAVRLSGIGKTVKEKVCVHTSRDIRAVASQLVSVWIEVFRKEKAANGGLKLLRQTSASASLKAKSSKDLISGKLLRTNQNASYNRGNMHIPSPPRKNSPTNTDHKKMNCKPVKIEITDSKADVRQWQSQRVVETLDSKVEDNNVLMSEEEAAAFAAAEAARAAALAAAEAYASKEAECSSLRDLPKIPSFHKFARREQYAQMDDSELRKKWSGGVSGRQDCLSDIDSRNCKVRNWSVDFSAACANLDSSRMSGDNYTQQSYSNEVMYQANLREHSGESVATDCRLTKAWVDSAGSGGVKDYHAIERWQSQAAAADSDFYHSTLHIRDEEDSNTASKPLTRKYDKRTDGSAASQAAENQVVENQSRGVEKIKKAVVEYVGSLLMPLYKARKIDKDGYKSIMKKSATKVMELTTDAEKLMTASEFLDFKRKNKIRAFVDKLIEKHMAMTPVDKP